MIFPGSRVWFEGTAADLSSLAEEIKLTSFSGHIVLEFQDSLDLVLVADGEFGVVFERIGRLITTKKYREIWGKCQIKTGGMTVFAIPDDLAVVLRSLERRDPLPFTGSGAGADLETAVRDRRSSGFSGLIDGTTPEGRGALILDGGRITSSYYSEFTGLSFSGIEAFRRWHESCGRHGEESTLFCSPTTAHRQPTDFWEDILAGDLAGRSGGVRPLEERLFEAFGRIVPAGEVITGGENGDRRAFFLESGRAELFRPRGSGAETLGEVGPGDIAGIAGLLLPSARPLRARAVEACRLLIFDHEQFDILTANSPPFLSAVIRRLLRLIRETRGRREAFTANPRLRDLEYYLLQAFNEQGDRSRSGLPTGDLLRHLSTVTPFSLPEIDRMVRDLVEIGRVELRGGDLVLHPVEI